MSTVQASTSSKDLVPLSVPSLRGNEWAYLKACLDTNWVSSVGPFVDRFEQDLAAYVGAAHAVATVNGTAALHTALLVAGVQPDDEVAVSTLSFIAPANAVRYVGAWPVFIDVEPDYWQMDPRQLATFLTERCRWANGRLVNRKTGRRVKAILPVHVLGHPCEMDPILELARRYELVVIEDATESLGATYRGTKVGHLGDIGCFSFNGNKIITTGGGGMLLTDRAEWAMRAKYLTTQAKDDPDEYVHHEVGYNYRLTNLQAAVGCAQLEQLEDAITAKRRVAQRYTEVLAGIPGLTLMREASWAKSVFWIFTVVVDEELYGMDSRRLIQALGRGGIQAQPVWQPLHESRAHQGAEVVGGEVAHRLFQQAVRLPSSVSLTPAQQDRVIDGLCNRSGGRT
ncbi:MAG: aminotransferase DegT [Candidatus Omnitrophica bacterium CG11_big_fil_rev_8_21_14_0_20_63_9]|nr:MAG: aminotransferase DegT [Candidatus Omnitrophica bacterium CG11_big_fil_rev_8_21_14_0_20_63_9]